MKQFIIIAAVIAALVIIIIASSKKPAAPNTFMSDFTNTPNSILVDIRTPEEFNSGHIANAINVDFYDPNFIENMKQLGTDKEFFIYCRSGARSGNAVQVLTAAGLKVRDLPGGISNHPELLQ